MSRPDTKKNQLSLNRAAGESAATAPAARGARDADATDGAPGPQAPSFGPVVGAVRGVGGAPEAGGSPGAGGFHACCWWSCSSRWWCYGVGAQATAPCWPAAALGASFAVQPSPGSSE